jgi:chromosome segregation ATPase
MGKGREDAIKRMAELIQGSNVRRAPAEAEKANEAPRAGPKTKLLTEHALGAEEDRISRIAKLISKPAKSLMETGNLPDLRRELSRLKSEEAQAAAKVLEAHKQVRRVEQGRNTLQSELEGLKAQETKLQEAMASCWKEESQVREQLDAALRQKNEEEIGLQDAEAAIKEIAAEQRKTQKEAKELKESILAARKDVLREPDRITKAEARISENIRKASDNEKRIAMFDKDLATAKAALESAIAAQREVAAEYDRVSSEKTAVEDAYKLHSTVDEIEAEKEKLERSCGEFRAQIAEKKKAQEELELDRKAVKYSMDAEEEDLKQTKKSLEAAQSRMRGLETKFSVYAELDSAAREVNAAEAKMASDMQALQENSAEQKAAADGIESGKQELTGIIAKENLLKKKLEEVLSEKQRLEDDLKEISDSPTQERLIIELPDVLREAIKKETEKITAAQEKIEAFEKKGAQLRQEAAKLAERQENGSKLQKLKERQLIFIREKLGSSGYSDAERLTIKKQMDAAIAEKKDLEARILASDAERKRLKSQLAKTDRTYNKVKSDIQTLEKKIEDARIKALQLDDEVKSNREHRIKAWAGSASALRILYPVKNIVDSFLDEKSRLKAELDAADRAQKKAEADLEAAEKFVERCRTAQTTIEEEYVRLQTENHALEKENNQLRAEKESLARRLKEDTERIPLMDAEAASQAARMTELKNQAAEKASLKKQHERGIRASEANITKIQKKLETASAQLKQAEEKVTASSKKAEAISAAISGENTKILRALDEKQTLEKQAAEYKRQETVIESEMRIIAGIYDAKV